MKREDQMKKIGIVLLSIILLFALSSCGKKEVGSAEEDSWKPIYEVVMSPNEEFVEKKEDIVYYTIKVYQDKKRLQVVSGSNSAFSKDMSYEIELKEEVDAEDLDVEVQWQTAMGDTDYTKENQLVVAVVKISAKGKVISERKISFISNAIEIIGDTVGEK